VTAGIKRSAIDFPLLCSISVDALFNMF